MGICLSNSGTLRAIDQLGLKHDEQVLEWRDNLLPFVSTSQVTDLCYSIEQDFFEEGKF